MELSDELKKLIRDNAPNVSTVAPSEDKSVAQAIRENAPVTSVPGATGHGPTVQAPAAPAADDLQTRLKQLEAKQHELTAGLDLDGAAALYNDEIVPLQQQIKAQERAQATAQAANQRQTKLAGYSALVGAGDFAALSAKGAAKVDERTGALGDIPGNVVRYYRQHEHPLYRTMTEQEVSIYDYLLGKGDDAGAQEYLELLNEDLRRRQGVAKAQEIQSIESPVKKFFAYAGQAAGAGVDSAVQGAVQAFREERMPTSATQFASAALQEDLSGIGKYAYMATNTVGNMLPAIAIGTLTGGVGGAVALGVSASGNAYNQALQEGYGKGEARLYSALVGASEATLQYLLGGIGKLGGVTDDMLLSRLGQLDTAFKRVLATGAVRLGSETTEEELQLFLEPAIRSLVFDVPYDAPNFEEMAETAIVTALSTGALESGNIASARKDPLVTALFGGSSGETAQNAPPNTAGERTAVQPDADTTQAESPAEGTQGRDNLMKAMFGAETENAASGTETAGEYGENLPQNVDMPTVPLIELSTAQYTDQAGNTPGNGNSFRGDAISRARTRLGLDQNKAAYIPASNVVRNGEEYVLKITKASLNKMLSPASEVIFPVESIAVMDNLERIANNGVWKRSEGDRNGRQQIKGFDHLFTTVYIDGAPHVVDMRVRLVQEAPGKTVDNVLYYFTPEEIVSIEKVDTSSPTVKRRAPHISFGESVSTEEIVSDNPPAVNPAPEAQGDPPPHQHRGCGGGGIRPVLPCGAGARHAGRR